MHWNGENMKQMGLVRNRNGQRETSTFLIRFGRLNPKWMTFLKHDHKPPVMVVILELFSHALGL